MNNLIKALKNEHKRRFAEFKSGLKEMASVEAVMAAWQYSDRMTPAKREQEWTLPALNRYIIERWVKEHEKALAEEIAKVEHIAEQGANITRIALSVEWKKSRMWGSNPTCEARVFFDNHYVETYTSGSIGGCGYDKESTAIAQAINQCPAFMKLLYMQKNRPCNAKKTNHDVFGYGAGYGILPALEGGVGVGCYPKIFKKIKLKWSGVASGSTFDVYEAIK